MFYHPHFCCHCGEKIVRARWTPFTSRRFCDFCAVEQKQHDLIPRAAAVLLLLFGAAGFTAYLSSGKGAAVSDQPRAAKIKGLKTEPTGGEPSPAGANTTQRAPSPAPDAIGDPSRRNNTTGENKQRAAQGNSSTETIYYCGAMTKKGTACTRRVKAPGRCWQHIGQPARIPSQN
jgi:hypothetical protein